MNWMGVVDVATLEKAVIGGNYFPGYIHRDNSFTYNQGSEVYLLDAPGGEIFVMQSYNAHTNDGLATEQSPATLGPRLTLPEGWKFRVRTLDREPGRLPGQDRQAGPRHARRPAQPLPGL